MLRGQAVRLVPKFAGNLLEEIGIEFSGIRPGEKLFEELLKPDEVHEQQIYPKINIGKKTEIFLEGIEEIIASFENLDQQELKDKLLHLANNKGITKPLLSVSV
ncbi:polysaccharide biosynthesis protein [Bacillota bacterium Lsc_1132]